MNAIAALAITLTVCYVLWLGLQVQPILGSSSDRIAWINSIGQTLVIGAGLSAICDQIRRLRP